MFFSYSRRSVFQQDSSNRTTGKFHPAADIQDIPRAPRSSHHKTDYDTTFSLPESATRIFFGIRISLYYAG